MLAELGVRPLDDERTQARGMLRRQFQGDGATEGNAENRGILQTQLVDERGEVVGIPGDVQDITVLSTETGCRKTVASQTVRNDLERTCQPTCQRKQKPPASRQTGHEDQRLSPCPSGSRPRARHQAAHENAAPPPAWRGPSTMCFATSLLTSCCFLKASTDSFDPGCNLIAQAGQPSHGRRHTAQVSKEQLTCRQRKGASPQQSQARRTTLNEEEV